MVKMRTVRSSVMAVTMIVALLTAMSRPAFAQTPQAIQAGTIVVVKTTTAVSPDARVGDPVTLTVVNDVTIGDRVVFKAGAPARGEVTAAQKEGVVGKKGIVGIRLQSVTAVDGTVVPVTATRTVEGKDNLVTAVVLGLLCLPLIFVVKGGAAVIPAGAIIESTTTSEARIQAEA